MEDNPCFTNSLSVSGFPLGEFLQKLALAADIPTSVLSAQYEPSPHNLELVRGWAQKRETTLPEDAAYSLVSLLDICLPSRYGIGVQTAWMRLQFSCYSAIRSQDIFSWNSACLLIDHVARDKTSLCTRHRSISGDPVLIQINGQGVSNDCDRSFFTKLPNKYLLFTAAPLPLQDDAVKKYTIHKERKVNQLQHNQQAAFVLVDEAGHNHPKQVPVVPCLLL
ncbi:hypothetical protein ONZ45_g7247 [Pleurotus djamor]|nr:hypothetical protein ONZ45_g7247 [Pleurotus djamor]